MKQTIINYINRAFIVTYELRAKLQVNKLIRSAKKDGASKVLFHIDPKLSNLYVMFDDKEILLEEACRTNKITAIFNYITTQAIKQYALTIVDRTYTTPDRTAKSTFNLFCLELNHQHNIQA